MSLKEVVCSALADQGRILARERIPEIPAEGVRGILLYGSQARGDAVEDSDVDLLVITTNFRKENERISSISYYTEEQFCSSSGSLFGAHLKRDSIVLYDPTGQILSALKSFAPLNADVALSRCKRLTAIFTTLEEDLPTYVKGLFYEARYLLRSTLYILAIQEGSPCFSVREISQRLGDEDLERLLNSRYVPQDFTLDLLECVNRLRDIYGKFPENKHGSLEAMLINEWERGGDLLSMAFLAVLNGEEGVPYSEVARIIL